MRQDFLGKTVLITGASMGIGKALAHAFADQGADLLLVARSQEKLEAIVEQISRVGRSADFIVADLTAANGIFYIVEEVSKRSKPIDVLINNAGKGLYGRVEKVSTQDWKDVFELNLFALVELTRLLLPFLTSPGGKIVNISSIAGHLAVPKMSAYAASKFALNAFSEVLRLELSPKKIDVISVYPGVTETGFSENAKSIDLRPHSVFSTLDRGMSAEKLAKKIVRATLKSKREEWVSVGNRIAAILHFLCPQLVDWFLKRWVK